MVIGTEGEYPNSVDVVSTVATTRHHRPEMGGRDLRLNRTIESAGRHPMTIYAHPSFQSTLTAGTRVAVKTRAGCWSSGFEIVGIAPHGGYQLRRISDGTVLAFVFGGDELRLDPV